MSSYNFYTLQDALVAALAQAPDPYNNLPSDWPTMYNSAILYAEHRISRDIVPLNERVIDTSLNSVAGSRYLDMNDMPAGPLTVVENIALITPTSDDTSSGTRQPFDVSSLDMLDMIWPQESLTMNPADATWIGRRWAMRDNHLVALAPTPDAAYQAVFTGLRFPTSLSTCRTQTFLSTWYPDLLFAACMIYLSGAMLRNFGAQSDDPRQSASWEQTYGQLMTTARDEEYRRRGLKPDIAPTPQAAQQAA